MSTTRPERRAQPRDPERVVHDGVVVPARGASAWLLVGVVMALAAVWIPLTGPVGMVAGSGAHLKGSRWGLAVAALAGVTTVAGMALVFFVRLR